MGIANFDIKTVKNMNSERKAYFEGLGVNIQEAHTLENAIKLAGLDYEVEKRQLYFDGKAVVEKDGKKMPPKFTKMPDMYATMRTDTQVPLGIVGKNYNILQNREAFDFLDSLIVGGAKFETAGTFKKNEAASFITVSTEPIKILDDDVDPYILLTNSFDGTGCVKVMFTPVRVFCSNTLVVANKKAHNRVSIRHTNQLESKLEVAKKLLMQNTKYLEELNAIAEKLAVTPFSKEAFEQLAKELFPVREEDSNIIQVRNLEKLELLMKAYKQDDLQNFNNTAWKVVQAVSDYESHTPVFRKTDGTNEKNIQVVMAGMPMLNMVMERMMALAK